MTRIAYIIPHVDHDPMRRAWVTQLRRDLRGELVIVERDVRRRGRPILTHLDALRRVPAGVTHVVQVQDDVQVVPGFVPAMASICALIDDRIVNLINTQNVPTLRLIEQGRQWMRSDGSLWGPAFMMPMGLVAPFRLFCRDLFALQPGYEHDDSAWSMFAALRGEDILMTTWSLADHLGARHRNTAMGHRPERLLPTKLPADASLIDWSAGLDRPPMSRTHWTKGTLAILDRIRQDMTGREPPAWLG